MMQMIASLLLVTISSVTWANTRLVTVDVKLSPAGSFQAKTTQVKGFAVKANSPKARTLASVSEAPGAEVLAENIEVDVNSLKTGIELRDQHLRDRLQAATHPKIKLIKASGQDGKGTATIDVKGLRREVAGTYSINNKVLTAEFPMSLADLKIENARYMGVGARDEIKITVKVPVQE